MIAIIILFLISLFLSSIMPNILREFIPFFMIAVIVIVSSFKVEEKNIYITCFLFGVIYDLMYTNLVIFHGFLYVFILFLCKMILKNNNFFLYVFTYYLMVVIYNITMFVFAVLCTNVNVNYIINMGVKSIFINSIFFVILYLLFIGIRCLFCNRKKRRTY